MFKKFINYFFIFIIILILLYSASFSSDYTDEEIEFSNTTFHYNSNSTFSWPLFGYYTISSFFGYRVSPTNGASTYHSGIDIPAPERN